MYRKNKHIRIVEFVGVPGCGKTTICRSMVDNSLGIHFLSCDTYPFPVGTLNKLLFFFQDFSICYFFALVYYIFANNISRKKQMFVYMINLRMKYVRFFREHRNDDSILLVDQGLVQGLGSMSLGHDKVKSVGLSFLLKYWKIFESSMLMINCVIPVEESSRRLSERNTLGGAFDRLRGKDLINSMSSHVRLLESVKNELSEKGFHMNRVTINTLNTIDNNIKRIFQEI